MIRERLRSPATILVLIATTTAIIFLLLRSRVVDPSQPRILQTAESTRFHGDDLAEVSQLISFSLFPATSSSNTPHLIILFDPGDWQGGLAATPLLHYFSSVLLPATEGIEKELARLQGSGGLFGRGMIVRINNAPGPPGSRQIQSSEILHYLRGAGVEPKNVLIVDTKDPDTALLAAPWAAHSGDLILFDPTMAPDSLPVYVLGQNTLSPDGKRIAGENADATAVRFARYKDRNNKTFGWGSAELLSQPGRRDFLIVERGHHALALLSANLARAGNAGPLLWSEQEELPETANRYLISSKTTRGKPPDLSMYHLWILGVS